MHKPRIFPIAMLLFALLGGHAACDDEGGDDEGGDDEGGDDEGGDDEGAPASDSGGGEGGGERVCGIIDPSLSDCDACAAENCCSAAEACGADAECSMCFFEPPAPDNLESPCFFNTAYKGLVDCVSGPCALACARGDSGGGDGGSGDACTATRCSDGPSGDATCDAAGCGACSFGYCLTF